jgi:hypothetical protein
MIDQHRLQSALARIKIAIDDAEYHDSMAAAARAQAMTLTRTWELCREAAMTGFCCGNPLDCQGRYQ